MIDNQFRPEGLLMDTDDNRRYISCAAGLAEAALEGRILEARAVLCDAQHNLHVELPGMPGVIPYYDGAVGIEDGTTRDIALISRVSKPVCFVVRGFEDTTSGGRRAVLSRRMAQEICRAVYIDKLSCGDIVAARVTRLEPFGAFCDIGCGIPALMPIAGLSVSRISHPSDRLAVGDDVLGVVSSLEGGRICLSQRELLGTWEENAALFRQGETVAGIIRSSEEYGVFVELTPNLAGLAESRTGVYPGQRAGVFIKSIIPQKMKIKLVIIDASEGSAEQAVTRPAPPRYHIDSGRIERWVYSPQECDKIIETDFTAAGAGRQDYIMR